MQSLSVTMTHTTKLTLAKWKARSLTLQPWSAVRTPAAFPAPFLFDAGASDAVAVESTYFSSLSSCRTSEWRIQQG